MKYELKLIKITFRSSVNMTRLGNEIYSFNLNGLTNVLEQTETVSVLIEKRDFETKHTERLEGKRKQKGIRSHYLIGKIIRREDTCENRKIPL